MTNDILQKLKFPAIGLIVAAVLDLLVGFLTLASGLLRLTGIGGRETLPVNEAEKAGFIAGTVFGYGVGFLSLVFAPVIFYGALKMMKGEKPGAAKTAAIFAVVPLSCCFPLSAIFGVWALIVLSKPEVKAFFRGEFPPHDYPNDFPPQPPQNW